MLRITPNPTGRDYRIKLEGCLCGPWVEELGTCWLAAATSQPGRRIRIDLVDVCHVDAAGQELLTLMYRSGVRFIATGIVMPELVRGIAASVERERRH